MPGFVSFPLLFAPLAGALAIWSSLYVHAAQRRQGRRAVEAELRRLGETAVTIEHVPLHKLADRAGLCGAHVFRITAHTAEGATSVHMWAHEPGLIAARRPGGLKRLAHGIWIPA